MQKQLLNLFPIAVVALSLSFLASCEKDEGKLPNIAFKTGGTYTSADKTVAKGATITVGITASKAEDKDVLKSFDASRSVNGAAAVSFFNETTTSANENNYDTDLDITVGSTAGTEKYTFTVVNRDGLTNSVSLTLTVQ